MQEASEDFNSSFNKCDNNLHFAYDVDLIRDITTGTHNKGIHDMEMSSKKNKIVISRDIPKL